MDDTVKLEVGGMGFERALAAAILDNKQMIISKVTTCKLDGEISSKKTSTYGDDNDESRIWCEFARKPVKPWCKWFKGETCHCENCEGACILKMVAWFTYLFHMIEEDELAMEIIEKLESCEDLYDELIPMIKQYRNDILVKYEDVKELDSDGKHSSMLKSLFNYIDTDNM